jgi:hypothetical protein
MFVRFAIWPAAIALLLASPGLAQDDDYARSGLYAGFAYSHGIATFDGLAGLDFTVEADSSAGFTAVAGYRVTPFYAVELDLEYMNGFELLAPFSGKIRTLSTTFNFNIYLLEGRVQPYVKFGGGLGWVDSGISLDSSLGFLLAVGVGGDYYLTRNIVLNFETLYIGSTGDISGTSHLNLNLGARYRF